jgi:hypothetical protein
MEYRSMAQFSIDAIESRQHRPTHSLTALEVKHFPAIPLNIHRFPSAPRHTIAQPNLGNLRPPTSYRVSLHIVRPTVIYSEKWSA